MNRRFGDARTTCRRLTPAERRTLELVRRLPLLAVEPARRLAGLAGPASTYRRLARLEAAGLVASLRTGVRPGPPPRLFHPTDPGRPLLAELPALPCLVALHELLGALAASVPGRPELLAWERPWRPPARYRAPRTGVVLLARAALAWGERTAEVLLLADPGTVPLAAYRPTLRGLLRLRAATGALPTLAVATHDGLSGAWERLLREVAVAAREAPLAAVVVRSERLARELRGRPWPPAGPVGTLRQDAPAPRPVSGWAEPRRPRPGGAGLEPGRCWPDPGAPLGARALGLGGVDRAVIDLVGRHAYLATHALAEALDWTERHARARCRRLVARGLLRVVGADELAAELRCDAALGLLELTTAGLRLAAAQLGLTLAAARRFVGLTGGGPSEPFGPRDYLLEHLEHTRGVDWVFVRFVVACRRAAAAGADAALLEWRNASVCANGRILPDGYGTLRCGRRVHGCLVEFDRGTMAARDLRAKLAAYHDYRDSGASARDYDGFPTVLVVAAGEDAEERFARAVRGTPVGPNGPLPLLLTTRGRLALSVRGPLGRIWRDAWSDSRRAWPQGTGLTATAAAARGETRRAAATGGSTRRERAAGRESSARPEPVAGKRRERIGNDAADDDA